jgi:hypothetical protein
MGRKYFDNNMVGCANYLLIRTPDMSGMHADLVPAGRMDNGRPFPVDPYFERPFDAPYAKRDTAINGVARNHPVVAADYNNRRPVMVHDRNKSNSGSSYRDNQYQVNQTEATDFCCGRWRKPVHTFNPWTVLRLL